MARRDLLSPRELERRATESGDQPFWNMLKWRFTLSAASVGVIALIFEDRTKQLHHEHGDVHHISEDPQQTARVLIALTASASVGNEFERLYNVIWGKPAPHPSRAQ